MKEETFFKIINTVKFLFWFMCISTFIVALFSQHLAKDSSTFFQSDKISYLTEFQLESESGKIDISVPNHLSWPIDKPLKISTILPERVEDNEQLFICSDYQDIHVFIDGKDRGVYSDKDIRTFGRSTPKGFLVIPLFEEDQNKTLEIEYVTPLRRNAGRINDVLIGTRSGFYYYLLSNYGFIFVIAAIMVIIGIVFIFFALVISLIYGRKQGMQYLGAFPLLLGLSIICSSYIRQFLLKDLAISSLLTYVFLDWLIIPLLCFLDEFQQYRYKKWYVILKVTTVINFAVSFLLHMTETVDYSDSILVFYVLMLLGIIVIMVCFIKDLRSYRKDDVIEVFVAFCMLAFFGVLEIINIQQKTGTGWGQFVSTGTLLFLIIVSFTTVNHLEKKQEESGRAIEANEAKTLFLANMSHEIRTPLNVILGMDEIILRESNTEEIAGYAQSIQESGRNLLYLINNILDISKIESGKMEIVNSTFDIRTFLDNICSVNKMKNKKPEVEFCVEINPMVPRKVISDEQHLRQILTNILSNALKYTNEGMVVLSLDCVQREKQENDNEIVLVFSVKDTGIGIKKEEMKNLFDTFTRVDVLKNKGIEGTGLGLAIVKQISEMMGGKIHVESEYGIGTTFTVEIPAVASGSKILGEYKPGNHSGKNRIIQKTFIAPEAHILIVDDNDMNLEVMKQLLKRTGIHIDTAVNGFEALKRTEEQKYDLVLLDQMMPGMDGIEVLQNMRKSFENKNKETKVIAVTANAVAGAKEMFLENGFVDFVSKPIEYKLLEESLERHLPPQLVLSSSDSEIDASISDEKMESLDLMLRKYDINMQEGMHYTGEDIQQYAKFLELYCKNYDKILEELKLHSKKKDIEFYTMKIHALKGNAKSIGALDLFYVAQRMEKRGKAGDYEYLKKSAYLLYLEMKRSKDGAEAFLREMNFDVFPEDENKQPKEIISEVDLKRHLEQLLEYVQELQGGEAVKLLSQMHKYGFDEECGKRIDLLELYLNDMQYDLAEEVINSLLNLLYTRKGK